MDLPSDKIYCHHTGFKKKCRVLVTNGACNRWMQVRGMNPNTGEDINRSDCVDNWTPILLIENSQMQRQTGAAVESFRNEMVRGNERTVAALLTGGKPRLISNDS
jgi:hypothetical protein